jgi:hypothetical protein
VMDVTPPVTPGGGGGIAWGTAGWTTDGGKHFDLGDSTPTESGRTLVRVTLFRGRDPTEPLDKTQAQGQELLCQLGGGLLLAPPRGTPVLVAIPESHGDQAGAAVIIAQIDMTSGQLYGTLAPGEAALHGFKGQARVLCKNNGTACLYTSRGNVKGGASVTVQANADGSVAAAGPFGGFASAQNATSVAFGTTSGMQCDASGAWLTGPAIGLSSGNVQLGPAPVHPMVLGDLLATQLAATVTFLAALSAYVGAIKAIADPTNVATPVLVTAIGVLTTALGVPNVSTTCKASA